MKRGRVTMQEREEDSRHKVLRGEGHLLLPGQRAKRVGTRAGKLVEEVVER